MTHGTQVVDFIWFDIANDGNQVGGIAEVTVVEKELDARIVTVSVQMIDTTSVETRRTTYNAMDLMRERERLVCEYKIISARVFLDRTMPAVRSFRAVECVISQVCARTVYPFSSKNSVKYEPS